MTDQPAHRLIERTKKEMLADPEIPFAKGVRANTGRKSAAERHPTIVEVEVAYFTQTKVGKFFRRMGEIAMGTHTTTAIDSSGQLVEVGTPIKDQRAALEYLINRALGKPIERVLTNDGKPTGSELPDVRYMLNGIELLQPDAISAAYAIVGDESNDPPAE
jgi:hypothetical protein